jgi:hypothetical protein
MNLLNFVVKTAIKSTVEKIDKEEDASTNIAEISILFANLMGLCLLGNKEEDPKKWLDKTLLFIHNAALDCYDAVKTTTVTYPLLTGGTKK